MKLWLYAAAITGLYLSSACLMIWLIVTHPLIIMSAVLISLIFLFMWGVRNNLEFNKHCKNMEKINK